MELSSGVAEKLSGIRKRQEERNNGAEFAPQDSSDILDLSKLCLDDEQTWLQKPSQSSSTINYHDWLYGKANPPQAEDHLGDVRLKSVKSIDTRTFTRPKKKLLRPSIIDYEQFHTGADTIEEHQIPKSKEPERNVKIPPKPLHFDLSQPASLNHFESMMNSGDTFQSMSPPSLVNSLCSSTFANLMENSFIKNDPVLREIRDKDFTASAMLEDVEAPMFQSISESCCSLSSDTPESFLRKVSFNGSCKIGESGKEEIMEGGGEGSEGNATFKLEKSNDKSNSVNEDRTFCVTSEPKEPSPKQSQQSPSSPVLNGTYRRTPKRNATFRKADNINRLSLNLTYDKSLNIFDNRELSKSIETDIDKYTQGLNTTRTTPSKTEIKRVDSVENMKRKYSNMDLNRLSYCVEVQKRSLEEDEFGDKEDQFEGPVEVERLSLGSAESLDRTSSLSNSSRGSNKMLNIADVDDIIGETRERGISGLISTPKVSMGVNKLWENNFLSPIVNNKEIKRNSVYSRVSNVDHYIKQTDNKDLKVKKLQRSDNLLNQRPLQALPINIKGSYSNLSNLKTTSSNFGGSQPRLSKPITRNMIRPPSTSNLRTMGSQLKGSYTSLRPISANLPVAPPIGSSANVVQVINRTSAKAENFSRDKVVTVPAVPISNLPRPTGIPRPASRIPGLRQNVRRATSKGLHY